MFADQHWHKYDYFISILEYILVKWFDFMLNIARVGFRYSDFTHVKINQLFVV